MTYKNAVYLCAAVLVALAALSYTDRVRSQPKGVGFNDEVISQLVKSAFNNDASLRSMDISINVYDRVVHLRGFVNSLGDSARAEALVRSIEGVSGVRNSIRVANRPSRAAVSYEVIQ